MDDIIYLSLSNMTKEIISISKLEALPENSSQKKQGSNLSDKRTPPIDFGILSKVVSWSFIIWGIITKLWVVWDSGFEEIEEDAKNWDIAKIKQLNILLRDLDAWSIIMNMATYGNSRLEIARSKWEDQSIDLIPFASVECLIDKNDSLIQTPKGGTDFSEFKAWEFIHLKRHTLTSRYYGDSIFTSCTSQISLLQFIDRYYENFFDRGLIRTKLIFDELSSLTDENAAKIEALIKDRMRGTDWSFWVGVVPWKLSELKLEDEMDIKGMREYRLDLIKSVAICLNIPYDLLLTDSGNRATSEASIEMFNQYVVKPLQYDLVRQLRKQLRVFFGDLVDMIEMIEIDTKNQKEEMEVLTWYKNAWVFTANMVLDRLWEKPIEWGDVLSTRAAPYNSDEIVKVKKIKEELSKVYSTL